MIAPSWWPSEAAWHRLTPEAQARLEDRLYAELGLRLRYSPLFPTPKQAAFLALPHREAFYGGAAGPGKSTALLMAALQYVDVPGYAALLLRRTFPQLKQPGALMDIADRWLGPTDAIYSSMDHKWTFPSGAVLQFGYLEHERDVEQYQSAEFHYMGFDELTQFSERQYRYVMGSRMRRPKESNYGRSPDGMSLSGVPIRVRGASNPGNRGHDWVKRRFVDTDTRGGRIFIRGLLEDNPHLDTKEYEEGLAELSLTDRRRLRQGDWEVKHEGNLFKRDWFRILSPAEIPDCDEWVRTWDAAASEPTDEYPDPDYTVGLLAGRRSDGLGIVVSEIVRFRESAGQVETVILETAYEVDGPVVAIRGEQEPGSSGKKVAEDYEAKLDGFDVEFSRDTGNKLTRAKPAASMAERGRIYLVAGPWLDDFLDEVASFTGTPGDDHDDQVDTLSLAVEYFRSNAVGTLSVVTGKLQTQRLSG